MKISKNSLQARINNVSIEKGVHANILLKSFFFDAFMKRLVKSEFAEDFIFKGGFFLSKKLGIEHRSTMDVDFLVRHLNLEEENIKKIMKKICEIDADDGVVLSFLSISDIREEDLYGGFNVVIKARFENIKERISIDVATGDPITPHAVPFVYKSLITNEEIHLDSYNLETVLAEKLQTVLTRGTLNSRCKDYYDIFIIFQTKQEEMNINDLSLAFQKTCQHRNTPYIKDEANAILTNILNSESMKQRWMSYAKKNSFMKGISFKETVDVIQKVIELVFSE